jgi:hypothetical protein
MMKRFGLVLMGLAAALSVVSCAGEKPSSLSLSVSRVPFIGCPAEGMNGPEPAPSGEDKVVHLDDKTIQRLAYYKGTFGPGILAPRGWHCREFYGSNGVILFVMPRWDTDPDEGFTGSAIQVSFLGEATSGRVEAAEIIARVFPSRMSFVHKVIKEGIEPASAFSSGLYPSDQVIYRRELVAEYRTPPHTEGLGTMSRLKKNYAPINGVIIENPVGEGYVLHAALRLPPGAKDLAPLIIRQFARDNTDELSKN